MWCKHFHRSNKKGNGICEKKHINILESFDCKKCKDFEVSEFYKGLTKAIMEK